MTGKAQTQDVAAIQLTDVRFAYPGGPQMRFDLSIADGERLAVLGPSGSGKSTLLMLMAGFEVPVAGRVLFAGQDMTFAEPAQRPVTSIFQDSNLFGHLTVAQNAGLGIAPRLRLSASERARVDGALAQVGLDGKQKRLPAALSGGERQRVALARALLRDRPVLLLDEPFASLGPALRSDMIDVVLALQAQKALTVIMVTHHAQDAAQFASRIAFIENGTLTRTLPATVLTHDGTLNAEGGHKLDGLAAYLGRR